MCNVQQYMYNVQQYMYNVQQQKTRLDAKPAYISKPLNSRALTK